MNFLLVVCALHRALPHVHQILYWPIVLCMLAFVCTVPLHSRCGLFDWRWHRWHSHTQANTVCSSGLQLPLFRQLSPCLLLSFVCVKTNKNKLSKPARATNVWAEGWMPPTISSSMRSVCALCFVRTDQRSISYEYYGNAWCMNRSEDFDDASGGWRRCVVTARQSRNWPGPNATQCKPL